MTIPPLGLDEQTSVETQLKLTGRYCVVLQTLNRSPGIEASSCERSIPRG